MKSSLPWLCLIGLFTCMGLQGIAQNIEDFVAKYTSTNGSGYMQPLADAVNANLNSGLYHSARIPKKGFNLSIGLVTSTALIGEEDKTFQATTDDFFQPQTTVEAPTILGSTEGVSVAGTGGTVYNFPGGAGINMLPVAVPQLTIGAIWGTEALIRFFAYDINEELGALNLLGWGIRHSISQYFGATFPVDLAAGYYAQRLSLGNFVDTQAQLISLQASYQKGIISIYGGPGYESSSMNIDYTYDTGETEENISLDLEGENKLRFTLGIALHLGPLYLNTDYNTGSQNVWSAGLGLFFGNK